MLAANTFHQIVASDLFKVCSPTLHVLKPQTVSSLLVKFEFTSRCLLMCYAGPG